MLEQQLSGEFDTEKRTELAIEMTQTLLDDHMFFFASHLKMSMVSGEGVRRIRVIIMKLQSIWTKTNDYLEKEQKMWIFCSFCAMIEKERHCDGAREEKRRSYDAERRIKNIY